MKHWQETEALLDRLGHLAVAGRAAALAVVVHIEGSVYRRPGARMLVEDDGKSLGGVSGGCLEEDVRQVGSEVLRTGEPRLRRYETGGDDTKVWGLGLGCNGTVEVFVQPVRTEAQREVWGRVRDRLRGDHAFAVRTVVAGPGTGGVEITDAPPEGASRLQASGPGQVFTEVLRPPPQLLVCGAGDDARPLVRAAAGVGFRVLVADHRQAYLTPARFPEARALFLVRPDEVGALPLGPQTHAVVMTHSLKHDREWARRLAPSEAPYIGLLGPRERAERILADIGVPRGPRIYGPVGLDLGAEGPEQVAVSIVAEVLAVRAQRAPGHLREKEMAVHA